MALFLASLPINIFISFAVFCRIGAFFMTAPAFGDFSLIPRLRLIAALGVTMALVPVVTIFYPDWLAANSLEISNPVLMAGVMGGELIYGGMLGILARVFMSALNVAGQIIAFQIGLSLAQIFDPTQELQGAIVGGFLAVFGTTMIFATGLHHLMLLAIKDSYIMFTPGSVPDFADMANAMTQTMSDAFSLGFRLASPFILFGLVFYIGAGVLNRLMPQAQVFFMLLPANLGLGLMILMLTSGLMMSVFLANFETLVAGFLR